MDYNNLSESVTVVAEGGVENWSVSISRPTIERILKSESKFIPDMIALWMFYAYTARWQKTNQPKATVKYVMKGMGWGKNKARAVRNGLKKLKLISDLRIDHGKTTGWYVKVNYLVSGWVEDPPT